MVFLRQYDVNCYVKCCVKMAVYSCTVHFGLSLDAVVEKIALNLYILCTNFATCILDSRNVVMKMLARR